MAVSDNSSVPTTIGRMPNAPLEGLPAQDETSSRRPSRRIGSENQARKTNMAPTAMTAARVDAKSAASIQRSLARPPTARAPGAHPNYFTMGI